MSTQALEKITATASVSPEASPSDSTRSDQNRSKEWTDAVATLKPWQGKAKPVDKFLLAAPLVIVALMIASKPFQPFLIAHHPMIMAALLGSNTSVGAAAAFASVNGTSLAAVIAAGVFGSLKFHWLFWLAGRRWGERYVAMFVPGEHARKRVAAMRHRTGLIRAGLFLGEFPGVPTVLVHVIAGWQQLNVVRYLILSVIGATGWVTLVALLGYSLGQSAVDVVLLIDRYALWVSLAVVGGMVALAMIKSSRRHGRRS